MPIPPFETITVHSSKVACDGGAGASSHPRVFLRIDHETGQVVCPYCSRLYVLSADAHHAEH